MKKLFAGALLVAGFALFSAGFHRSKTVHGQITIPATTGMVAPLSSGAGLPGTIITCNASANNMPFWNTVSNVVSACNGTNWVDLVSPPTAAPVAFYSNGTLQSPTTKCGYATGTSSASGSFTFNPSTALSGITTIIGVPQPTVTAAASTSANVTLQTGYTATSATVFVQTASIISVVGINVTLFSNAALPVSIFLCGR